ncbi:protein RALF-like 33 [Canna indica]|uniref:Protein RALF-like 33 n=1 Tax=Canna indica TaxID=4628 RepID=A0AAQ3KLJ1_9LILI|nr:protein RALF-like 33 [Canna indica]
MVIKQGKALNLTFLLALVICTTFLPTTISVQDNNDRRILDNINYGTIDSDRIPCKLAGASHENCRPHAEANAYSHLAGIFKGVLAIVLIEAFQVELGATMTNFGPSYGLNFLFWV